MDLGPSGGAGAKQNGRGDTAMEPVGPIRLEEEMQPYSQGKHRSQGGRI